MPWTPKPRPDVDPFELPLDVQQGYLLSRLDGVTDRGELASLTGMEPEKVEALLADLVRLGAIDPDPEAGPERGAAEPKERPEEEAPQEEPPAETDEVDEAPIEDDAEPTEAERAESDAKAATHRQLYEQSLHPLPSDQRVAQAKLAEEPELSAYCFDPEAKVVAALLENPRFANVQARLVAAHHRTTAGLDLLAGRTAFTHDGGVRRALLGNPLLPPSLYRRLWSNRRLLEQFLVTSSRDAPEQVRAMARDTLRTVFNQRGAEEKVELILTTEGRCLAQLVGLTLDGHATALMCRRTYVSTLLIQNIARWSAAPPQLIAHLRKQDVVKRNAQLRMMLERHPNAS